MKEIFYILIGAVCSIIGGMISIWYQAKKARKIKIDELIVEKKIEAINQAYYNTKQIESMLIQSSIECVCMRMHDHDIWFISNRLFLPINFTKKWLLLKNVIDKINLYIQDKSDKKELIPKLYEYATGLIRNCYKELYKEIDLPIFEAEEFLKENK
ncbi:MAG: hypothetical protein PHI58_00615 [Candidatus Omnitrophica bacterium]|nr:hypothetical protein [Candidatus Omnitrophota bacterium]